MVTPSAVNEPFCTEIEVVLLLLAEYLSRVIFPVFSALLSITVTSPLIMIRLSFWVRIWPFRSSVPPLIVKSSVRVTSSSNFTVLPAFIFFSCVRVSAFTTYSFSTVDVSLVSSLIFSTLDQSRPMHASWFTVITSMYIRVATTFCFRSGMVKLILDGFFFPACTLLSSTRALKRAPFVGFAAPSR